ALAAARRPDQRGHAALRHVHRDAAQCREGAVPGAEVTHLEGPLGGLGRRRSREATQAAEREQRSGQRSTGIGGRSHDRGLWNFWRSAIAIALNVRRTASRTTIPAAATRWNSSWGRCAQSSIAGGVTAAAA